MKTIKSICSKHYYSIIFFAFILLYNFIVTAGLRPWEVSGVTHDFHLVDFSMGFCTKFLPGAIYNFLFDDTGIQTISLYETVLFVVFVFLIALMLEKLMVNTALKDRTTMFFLLMLFMTGTSTFSMYVYQLGMLDAYWLYFTVLFLLFLSNKWLYIFIIPVSLLMVLTHYAVLVAFIPFAVLLMLYKVTIAEDKKEKGLLWAVLIISALSSFALGIYFLMFENENLTYTLEEFNAILKERGLGGESIYYSTSLYEANYFDVLDTEFIDSIESPVLYAIATVYYRIAVNFKYLPFEEGIVPLLLDMPVVVLILSYFRKKIKEKQVSKLKGIVFFGMSAMFFCTILLSLFLSTDIARFIGHSYTLLFTSFLYVIHNEKDDALTYTENFVSKVPKALTAIYLIFYAFMIFDPYC